MGATSTWMEADLAALAVVGDRYCRGLAAHLMDHLGWSKGPLGSWVIGVGT